MAYLEVAYSDPPQSRIFTFFICNEDNATLGATMRMECSSVCESISRPGKRSASVRVSSYVFGCIFFPQIEISVSYKIHSDIDPVGKKNGLERRKNNAANKHPGVAF